MDDRSWFDRNLRGALVLALTAVLTCVGPPLAAQQGSPADLRSRTSGEDWPSFLGPRGNGSSIETGILTKWPQDGLRIVWSVAAGTGYGASSTSRGRCFLFDREGDQARLRCLESETGKQLWTYQYPSDYEDLFGFDNGPRTTPVVDDQRVYVFGAEGELHCVSVADGKKIWSVDTADQYGVVQNFFGVGSTPVVDGNRLLVMVGGSPPEDQSVPPGQLDRVTSNGSCIVALNKRTGQEIYKTGDDLASYASIRTLDLGGRRVALAFARSGLLGVDVAKGSVLFQYPWRARKLESVNAASPLIQSDRVFITESYELGGCQLRLDAQREPEVTWRDPPRSRQRSLASHWMTPVLKDGFMYGCSGESNSNAELRCVNWQTGEVAWSQEKLARCSLLSVDDHLLAVNEFGHLWLIEANSSEFKVVAESENLVEDGKPLLKKPVWPAPVLSHGLLYLRGAGRLVCAELIPSI